MVRRMRLVKARHLDKCGYVCQGALEIGHKPHRVSTPDEPSYTHNQELTVDHVVPIARGGSKTSATNMRVVCFKANQQLTRTSFMGGGSGA